MRVGRAVEVEITEGPSGVENDGEYAAELLFPSVPIIANRACDPGLTSRLRIGKSRWY